MPRVKPKPMPAPLPDRPGRWKLLWRRQRRLLRPTFIASAAATALLCGVLLINMASNAASLRRHLGHATAGIGLDVQQIDIEGRQKTPESTLRAAIGVERGDPILSFSVAEARARIEKLTWVRSAIVERRLPGTIRVVLNERSPFAVWQNQGKFVLIDRAGGIVTDSDVAAFSDKLPLIVGQGAPAAAAALLDALGAQPELLTRLVAAIRVGERRWNLCMSNGAEVLLPEGAEPQALAKLADLNSSKSLLDRPLQEIDMRLPNRLSMRALTDAPCGQRTDPTHLAAQPPRKAT